jgi:hypothetical protein
MKRIRHTDRQKERKTERQIDRHAQTNGRTNKRILLRLVEHTKHTKYLNKSKSTGKYFYIRYTM